MITSESQQLAARIDELERQMRRERFRLSQALDMAEAGAWEWDAAKDQLWWSPQMFALFDVNPESFSGKYSDFEDALAPECVEQVRASVAEANRRGVPFRMTFMTKAGRHILASGRMEGGVMHGINMDASFGVCADCPVKDQRRQTRLLKLTTPVLFSPS